MSDNNHPTTEIRNATVYTGELNECFVGDVAISDERIIALGDCSHLYSEQVIDATGLTLAPGFIDVHTHDDLEVLRNPHMLCKVSQGVTTVIAGNCGISSVPYAADIEPVDPINLLGQKADFKYPNLADFRIAFDDTKPSVNLAQLIGHTSLRAQVMNDLSKAASEQEITQMQSLLRTQLEEGALGLSTGLAYPNAKASSREEVNRLAKCVTPFEGVYTTHLRTEFQGIIDAMDEAFATAKQAKLPLIISHLKCAGIDNWGRAQEVLAHLEDKRQSQLACCDCYPYAASSSTLDLNQVTDSTEIYITWSETHPEMAEKSLRDIANNWQLSLMDAAKKLMPAGAVYHCMFEDDVKQFLSYENSMIGSDGLPCDPHPHPRLWGTFPRVLGHYAREQQTLSLALAIHKMTALPSSQFKLNNRGKIAKGYFADLVLFDANTIIDNASYQNPQAQADGIKCVWVNGKVSFVEGLDDLSVTQFGRAGRFLSRT